MDKEQALIILKELHKDAFYSVRTALETLIPEIKEESNDERIRKEIIEYIKIGTYRKDWISWLEKQGERDKFKDAIQIGDKVTRNRDGVLVNLSQLERVAKKENQGEPKFHKGQWIACRGLNTAFIINIHNDRYEVEFIDGSKGFPHIDYVDRFFHLWSIKDAKPGDVLACGDEVTDCPFIFHNLNKELNPRSYCGVNTLRHFQDNDENGGNWCYSDEVRPATKEQCDFLFLKMKEAGYEWDAEKKELKKIEKKIIDKDEPKFHEGDWIVNNNSGGVCQVTRIRDNEYCLWPLDSKIEGYLRIIDVDNDYHLWSINDAKEGNIIYIKHKNNDEWLLIFKKIKCQDNHITSCDINIYNYCAFCITDNFMCCNAACWGSLADSNIICPATKEQRDLLFSKIRGTGHEWNEKEKVFVPYAKLKSKETNGETN